LNKFFKGWFDFETVKMTDFESDPKSGEKTFYLETKDACLQCSSCESKDVIKKGSRVRRVRDYPTGFDAVFLQVKLQRLHCKNCGKTLYENSEVVEKKKDIPEDWPFTPKKS